MGYGRTAVTDKNGDGVINAEDTNTNINENDVDDMNKFFDVRAQYQMGKAQLQLGLQSLLADPVPGTMKRVNGNSLTAQRKQRFGLIDNITIL